MPGPRRRIAFLVCACFVTLPPPPAPADEFDRLGDADLSRPVIQKHARKQAGLNFRELAALPAVLRDARSSLLIVVTDQGNVARLIASPGFRKAPGDPNKLTPTLVVDRFETRDPANRAAPLARGKDAWLFDGFGYDLDAGQVVPVDMGADVRFVASGSDDGRLIPVGKAELFVVESLPPAPKASADRPSEGRVVRPADYNGSYRLAANGVWSGLLELKVDPEGVVTGNYRSDSGGAPHPVTGKTTGDHGVEFTVTFPRTRQDYSGWLWGEGKNVIAGSVTMINQTFSFVAVREGATASLATLGLKIAPGKPEARALTLDESGENFLIDADPATHPLSDLAELLKADLDATVVVKAPGAIAFERVRRFVQAIEDAGARSVRLAPIDRASP
ncbi:hypothetical protein [Paludisphaera borealis]|uniref:Uncharacterized protein n=1 Tax=Paludisphaera borealis TaxID=1387353 RepID=A0A1U7CY99_9BACT|nr:hypothetical protein [Paludisphaera borealis]APW63868.1 hypothetical protein BSF38_05452 [Paludisphaera borealis]